MIASDEGLSKAGFVGSDPPAGGLTAPINFLTSVPNVTPFLPDGWECGVEWDEAGCSPVNIWGAECDPDRANPDQKIIAPQGPTQQAWAFDVYYGVDPPRCAAGSAEEIAAANLSIGLTVALSEQLHKTLAAKAKPLSETAVCLEAAVGLLFAARARLGIGGGVLSIPDILVGAAVSSGIITRTSGRYTSIFGAPVIVGPGFPNRGPASVDAPPAAGSGWMYVHGAVDYALGPVEQIVRQPSLSGGRTNRVNGAIAERRALVRAAGCGVFALPAMLPATCAAEISDCPPN